MNPGSSADRLFPSAQLAIVLEEVARRRLAGEALSDEAVMEMHGALMPELAGHLRELQRVEAARRRAVLGAPRVGEPPLGDSRLSGSTAHSPASAAEDIIAGYEILNELHRGGQGIVYRAIQRSTEREVAVKVLRSGPWVGPSDMARFEREARILARIRHPHIVTIHDFGRSTGGQLYFVMDYIAGRSLGASIAAAAAETLIGRRPTSSDLRLFEEICEAVHAAHLHGVIHRDLKPSNIQVDEAGEPHVLDFGLARMTEAVPPTGGDVKGDGSLTITGQFVGSLPWASPEQVDGAPDGIDLRTDVYSLGIILYQLLTGRFPYPVTGPMRVVQENIRLAPPLPPRTANPRLDADLETIVLKCLAKEPQRRYQSAGEIAAEIARHRCGEPIAARRDSTAYLIRKALRRHWAAASAAAGFVLLITVAAVALAVLYRGQVVARSQAQAEAAKARCVAGFLQDMLQAADPHHARGKEVTVRETLEAASAQLSDGLGEQPEVAAAIHRTIGQTYFALGDFAASERHFRDALGLTSPLLGEEHPDSLAAMTGLATAVEAMNRYDEAEPLYRRVLEAQQRLQGIESPDAISAMNNLANLERNRGRLREAEALLVQTLNASNRVLGPDDPDTLITRKLLASVWADMGRVEEAERVYRAVWAAQRRVAGGDSPETLGTAQHLAMLLKGAGRLEEAEPIYREVVEAQRRVHGDRHPETLRTMNSFGRLLQAQGKLSEAETIFRQTMSVQREILGDEHSDTLVTTNNLALLLQESGRAAEAEPLARRVEQIGRRVLGDAHPDALIWTNNLGNVLYRLSRFQEARGLYARAAEGRRRALGETHPATLTALENLANVDAALGWCGEAESLAREAVQARRALQGPDHPETLSALEGLARVLEHCGSLSEAEQLARETLDRRTRTRGPDHPDTLASVLQCGRVLVRRERFEEARELLEPALAVAEQRLGAQHWLGPMLSVALGESLAGLQRPQEAEFLVRSGCDRLEASLGPDHPRTQDALRGLASMYETWNRNTESAAIRARLIQH